MLNAFTLQTTDQSISIGSNVTVTGIGALTLDTKNLIGGGDLSTSGELIVQNVEKLTGVKLTAGSVGSGHSITITGADAGVVVDSPITLTADSIALTKFNNGIAAENLVNVETKKLTASAIDDGSLNVFAKGGLSDSTSSVTAGTLAFGSNGNVKGTFTGTTSASIELTGNFEGAVTSADLAFTTNGNVNMTTGSNVTALTLTQNGTTRDFALDNGDNSLKIKDIAGDFNNVSITAGDITTDAGAFSAALVDINASKFDGANLTVTAPALNVTNKAAADTNAVFSLNGSIDVIDYTATNDTGKLTVVNDGNVTLKVNSDVYTLNASATTGVLTLDTDVTTTYANDLVLSGADGVVAKNITSKGAINITSANGDITAGILDSNTGIFAFNAAGAVEATNLTSASADHATINLSNASSVSLASDRDTVSFTTLPAEISGDFALDAANSAVSFSTEFKAANADITAKSFETTENVTTSGDLAITATDGVISLQGATTVAGVYALDASANGLIAIADAQTAINDGSSIKAKGNISIASSTDALEIGAAVVESENGTVTIGDDTHAIKSITGAEITTAGDVAIKSKTIDNTTIDPANVNIYADSVAGSTIEATTSISIDELTADNGVDVTTTSVNAPTVTIDHAKEVSLTSTSNNDTEISVTAQATSTDPVSIAQTGLGKLTASVSGAALEEISISTVNPENKLEAQVVASNATLTIDAAGDFELTAGSNVDFVNVTATGSVVLNDADGLTIEGITTQDAITATVGGDAVIEGTVSGTDIVIEASSITGAGEIDASASLALAATVDNVEIDINAPAVDITAKSSINVNNLATGDVTVSNLTAEDNGIIYNQAGTGVLTFDNGGATAVSAKEAITIATDGSIDVQKGIISGTAGDVSITGKAGISTGADGAITATDGSVTLNAENGAVTTAAAVTAGKDTNAGDITVTAHDAIEVAALNAGGKLSITSTDNGVKANSTLTAGGNIDIIAGQNDLVDYDANIELTGKVKTTNGYVKLVADHDINAAEIEASDYVTLEGDTLNLGANIKSDKAVTLTANDSIVQTAGKIEGTAVTATAKAGSITFVDEVKATTGDITIDSAENSVEVAKLTATKGAISVKAGSNGLTETTAVVTLNDEINAGTNVILAADGDITLEKALEAGKDTPGYVSVTAAKIAVNANITANSPDLEGNAVTLNATKGTVTVDAAATITTADGNGSELESVLISATGEIKANGAVVSTGDITVASAEDDVSVAALTANSGTVTVEAGSNPMTNTDASVTLAGAIAAKGIAVTADLDVTSENAAALNASAEDIAITASTGAVTLGTADVTAKKNVNIAAATNVTASGAVTAR